MAYTRLPLFLGILFVFTLLISIAVSARDIPESDEENKVHVVKHLFGRNHHRCKHHGVGCKDDNPQEGKDTTSEEVENKQGADAQEQAVEDNKVHVVKHLFRHFRHHHHCKHYGGAGCQQELPQAAGKEAADQQEENQGFVNTEEDQKDVSHGGGKN